MAGAGSRSGERKAQILQAFAAMLEQHPGGRITTAALARNMSSVGLGTWLLAPQNHLRRRLS